jgi:hypothetical protein
MHPILEKEFRNLKVLADEKEVPLAIIETTKEVVSFVSSGKKLVCLVLVEDKIHNMLTCFKVNINKWSWAENEGFDLEQGIPDDLVSEILIKFNTPQEYLGYLGL